MNYDGSQQYSFNFGFAAAAAAAAAAAGQQQPAAQNVSRAVYPYTLQGAGELHPQQLQAKVAATPTGPAVMAGKSIMYDPQQHQFQQQQQQPQPHTPAFSMVQGGTLVGRQGMFPVAAGLQVAPESLCSSQALSGVYGNLSPNLMTQKGPSAVAVSAPGYKNSNWMDLTQGVGNNVGNNNAGNTNAGVPANNPSALPSFGHLWSHFQQQQQQKHQTTVATFVQSNPQHQQPASHQQPGLANLQSVHVFPSPPAGLQVSSEGLQVSPGGLQVSPSSLQLSPGGQTFQVPPSLQGTMSPIPLATAGVSFSGLRQVHMSGAVGGSVGGGIQNQVVVAPRGQVIMAPAFPTAAAAAAATFSFNNDMKNLQPLAKMPATEQITGVTASTVSALKAMAAVAVSSSSASPPPSPATTAVEKTEASKDPSPAVCCQVALTTTTVTVSACSLNTTTATTIHIGVPVAASISGLPKISTSSCEHVCPATPLSCLPSDSDMKDGSGRGSVSPSTPSTATSSSTQESTSEESGKLEMNSVKVPYSWLRVVENGTVHYFSPSQVRLSSLEEIRAYLSQSNTCKCGLECPLMVERTFSFDPALEGRPWSMEDVTCSQDLTKLCNHKRKVLALAAFQSSTAGQDSHSKSDGPSAKCRKREKGKHGDTLLVSPLVVDSKLKTSITNAVNKHAAQNLGNPINNLATLQAAPAADGYRGGGSVHGQGPGPNVEGAVHLRGLAQIGPAAPGCVAECSASVHHPTPSPASHSPASMRSTPGISLGGGAEPVEGVSPMAGQYPCKMDLGRTHSGLGSGMRMGPNHVDARAFQQSALQCNVFPQDEMKQSYFMQQQLQQQQLQQQQLPHAHPPNQFNACGVPVMTPSHPGPPPFGAQTFRTVGPCNMQSQYPLGFPHGQHQHQQTAHLYPQHSYPMVYQMNLSQQQQQQQHAPHQQQLPHPPQNLHPHHQTPSHSMFQNVRLSSQPVWPPQRPPAHHSGPVPPQAYHPDPHQMQGGNVFPNVYPQAAELMWLETGKPKSKRPRSKKDKQKLNSIVDRTSPCGGSVKQKLALSLPAALPKVSKCLMPSTTTVPAVFPTTVSTTTLPCSVSFLENPAIFVAQQTAIINNSLASCHIDLNSPTNPPGSAIYPKIHCDSVCTIPASVPTIKVEQDCTENTSDASPSLKQSEIIVCKKEPATEMSLQHADFEKSMNALSNPEAQKTSLSSVSVNCNNNQLVVSKNEPDLQSLGSSVSLGVDCSCRTGSESLHPKKKASPKSRLRTKTVPTTTKVSSVAPISLPECPPSAMQLQNGHAQLPTQQPTQPHQQHPPAAGDANITGAAPLQLPELSQLLTAGNGNWNILPLQQALAQYASVSPGGGSVLNVSSSSGSGANGSGMVEFPASSLLTAAARAQLSQQAALGSILLPAFLSAGGVAGQDVSAVTSGLVQQPQQPAQQPDQPSTVAQVENNSGAAEVGMKAGNTVMAAGVVGVSPVSMATMNQTGQLPVQLMHAPSVAPTGIVSGGSFPGGALLTHGMQTVQGLPLNVLLPINQQLLGLGTNPIQGFPMDVSGSIVASIALGTAVCKTLHVSPKLMNTMVDSVAAVSPGASVTAFSSMGSVPATFSAQGCENAKGTGSTIHHLPQNNLGQSMGQNGSHNNVQNTVQNLGQAISQSVGQSVGQNVCPSLNASANPAVGQNVGVNVSLGLGTGETVMLNSLLPSILALNTPMPPISLPMVTNVTNSLTQVIPAAGATPALLAQQQHQQQQQQQQQQATAQFLNALAIPAVAAAAALNPLLIAHPGAVSSAATSPGSQFFGKPAEGTMEEKGCPMDSKPESECAVEDEGNVQQEMEEVPETGETVRMVDVAQSGQPQALPITNTEQGQQQVIVLQGGGLPLMQVLNNNPHTLGTASGVVDKLCNTTQIFLPTAPPSATLPDLTQLGTVAALTPLGIQQMWNSLNSLQLQQLQTLQLQQLVWQQLQGMQALPHHVQTVDSCSAVGGQSLPMQFFPGFQQLHCQQAQQTQPLLGQQQVHVAVTLPDTSVQEGEGAHEEQDSEAYPLLVGKQEGGDAPGSAQTDNKNVVAENLDRSEGTSSMDWSDTLNCDGTKNKEGFAEGITECAKPLQKSASAATSTHKSSSDVKDAIQSAAASSQNLAFSPRSAQGAVPRRDRGQAALTGEGLGVTLPCVQGGNPPCKEKAGADGMTEALHVAVNGDCLGPRHPAASRRRGMKRGLDNRCIAAGSGSVDLMSVPVMSRSVPKLVGQGTLST